jgi:hypothetical protein
MTFDGPAGSVILLFGGLRGGTWRTRGRVNWWLWRLTPNDQLSELRMGRAGSKRPSRSWADSVARRRWPMRAGGGGVSSSEVAAWHWIVREDRSRVGRSPQPHTR